MIRLIEEFSDDHTVFIYGQEKYFREHQEDLNKNICVCEKLEEALEKSNIVVSGIPFSKDEKSVNSLYSDKEIQIENIFNGIEGKLFIAGGIPVWFYENRNICNYDLLESEELTILNAIPTAEGTIKIAMEETEKTIHESNVLIFGFGRIGKILCKRFFSLGANVYCTEKKDTELSWIREARYITIEYQEIEKYIEKIDLIINTAPSLVITERILKKLKKDCLIIDIASPPGGVDKNIAKMYKIRVITALGIPGKIAPKSAAKYIKVVIDKKIKERRYVSREKN